MKEKQIVVYESDDNFRLEVKTDGETVWLSGFGANEGEVVDKPYGKLS